MDYKKSCLGCSKLISYGSEALCNDLKKIVENLSEPPCKGDKYVPVKEIYVENKKDVKE